MSAFFKLRDLIRPPAEVLQDVGLKPGMQVLDFGCGPGSFALEAAKRVGPSGRVYAVDRLALAVERVCRKGSRQGLANLEAIQTDGATGLEDESIDLVLLFDIFHSLDHPERILEEICRVLKPTGGLWVSDHHLKADEIGSGVGGAGPVVFSERRGDLFRFDKAADTLSRPMST
ncbi:MAG: class I SAM-dependent methyltransferase [Desulfobacterales bacterium]|nr:class I SAM-dependent methyltransferase [Desulfobacterales bacterium]